MKRLSLIILLIVLVSACGNKEKVVAPSTLLSEQEMIDILTDVQIIEADLNLRRSNGAVSQGMVKAYYDQLFEHYNITDSIYEENMHYYTRVPATIERIMDSVYQRILREQENVPDDNKETENNEKKPPISSLQRTKK